jgi:hypothetical protein
LRQQPCPLFGWRHFWWPPYPPWSLDYRFCNHGWRLSQLPSWIPSRLP